MSVNNAVYWIKRGWRRTRKLLRLPVPSILFVAKVATGVALGIKVAGWLN